MPQVPDLTAPSVPARSWSSSRSWDKSQHSVHVHDGIPLLLWLPCAVVSRSSVGDMVFLYILIYFSLPLSRFAALLGHHACGSLGQGSKGCSIRVSIAAFGHFQPSILDLPCATGKSRFRFGFGHVQQDRQARRLGTMSFSVLQLKKRLNQTFRRRPSSSLSNSKWVRRRSPQVPPTHHLGAPESSGWFLGNFCVAVARSALVVQGSNPFLCLLREGGAERTGAAAP
ncbi:hypothetical protein CH063_12756 [Colletotrichum higginsianum]|uniref:Uncharacterized protein n=1 Tax=Colletotrichum higginsianum (strain IMI 349063) TaxID=759273 RepID=H1VRN4_COLHI|nr:hypothetical protein CH063_12756 [Colletotrichum higginsianum]